ncbi:MAG: metallophosphoesterase [Pirellulales bacterium]
MAALNDATSKLELAPHGIPVWLLAERALYIPGFKALVLADTHFGKATSFRAEGLAVPGGATRDTLRRIQQLLDCYAPQELIVLGDFIHAAKQGEKDYLDELHEWRESNRDLTIHLVEGNHDRHNRRVLKSLNLVIHAEGWSWNGFVLNHYPQSEKSSNAKWNPVSESENGDQHGETKHSTIALCGHLHPGVRLATGPKMSQVFPCFVLGECEWILPAFGAFTGMKRVAREDDSEVVACVDGYVMRISTGRSS